MAYIIIGCQSLSDYDRILAMLLELSMNGRLQVTRFPVPTISETVSQCYPEGCKDPKTSKSLQNCRARDYMCEH